MKLFVAITILTTPAKEERVQLLNKWIEIAIETKTSVGNLFGFTSVMLGLILPEVILLLLFFFLQIKCTNGIINS